MSAKSNRFILQLVLALAILGGAAAVALRSLRPVAVVEPVTSGEAIDAKPGNVTVEESFAMELRSEQGGRVLEDGFALEPGDHVKKGQVVAQLDPRDIKLAIDRDQTTLVTTEEHYATDHSLELTLETATATLENNRRENQLGAFSATDLAAEERTVKVQQQGVELQKIDRRTILAGMEYTLKNEQLQLERMSVKAPGDMVVKAVYVHPGDLIGALNPIATLISERKHVVGKISDEDFAEIKEGQSAVIIFVPYGSYVFNGRVSKILPTTDPLTQRHNIYLEVSDIADEKLVPGISGEVSVTVHKHLAAAVVPRRAVFSLDGDNVYVVKDGRVELRKVTKGYVWARGIEITQGLEPGEKVIVEGLEAFHAGQTVAVEEHPSDVIEPKK